MFNNLKRWFDARVMDSIIEYNRQLDELTKQSPFKRVGKFEKVSLEQFRKDVFDCLTNEQMERIFGDNYSEIDKCYEQIKLPTRGTFNAIGNDFDPPFKFDLKPDEHINVPTGIKCSTIHGWGLLLAVRSGCGRHRIQFDDILPVIDGDYYNSPEREGDIIVHITNDNKDGKTVVFDKSTSFIQGFFIQFGVTKDDKPFELPKRQGGYGSTGNKNNTR